MKYLPIVISAIVSIVVGLSDVLQPYIASNPTLAVIVAAVATIVASLTRSPLAPKP